MSIRPIKPLRSDADYDAALEEIESLFASEPGSEDADRLEVLANLAQNYQRLHQPIGPPDVASVVEFELDRRGLARQDTAAHAAATVVEGVAEIDPARRSGPRPVSVR